MFIEDAGQDVGDECAAGMHKCLKHPLLILVQSACHGQQQDRVCGWFHGLKSRFIQENKGTAHETKQFRHRALGVMKTCGIGVVYIIYMTGRMAVIDGNRRFVRRGGKYQRPHGISRRAHRRHDGRQRFSWAAVRQKPGIGRGGEGVAENAFEPEGGQLIEQQAPGQPGKTPCVVKRVHAVQGYA